MLSIITVNFNGRAFLKNLFDSVQNLNYPSSKMQVIMVDNNSTDGSPDYVNKQYPWVEVVPLDTNRGYAGGNNQGFKAARGQYIALINNDCIVDPDWADNMVSAFESSGDPKLGAVGSKVVFYYPYIALQLSAERIITEGKGTSPRAIGIHSAAIAGASPQVNRSIKYLEGFYPCTGERKGKPFYWAQGKALLALPIPEPGQDLEFEASICSPIEPNRAKISVAGKTIGQIVLKKEEKMIRLSIPKSFYAYSRDIINSCGVMVNRSFYARERGYLSFDEGQYASSQEVFGLSGTSFMVRRKMLEDVGAFDFGFFTYYEDIDLFWRARLKGWKSLFVPSAVARHYHCGTGGEWSYDFTYYVLRNRILMIFKCGWPALFLRSYAAFFVSMLRGLFQGAACLLRGRRPNRADIPIRVRLFLKFFFLLAAYFKKRINIRGSARAADSHIKAWIKDF